MITPTVGRVVLYRPTLAETSFEHGQPFRADVCYVNEDGTVNLAVNSETGRPFCRERVTLAQGREAMSGECYWMEYQKQQAMKSGVDALTKATSAPLAPMAKETIVAGPKFASTVRQLSESELEAELAKRGYPRVTEDTIAEIIVGEKYFVDDTLTICVLTLRNGFKVIGQSACVDARNFDEAIGQTYARKNAVQQIWQLEGYALAERMLGTILAR